MIDAMYTAIIGHIIEAFFLIATIGILYGVRYIRGKLTAEQQRLLEEITRASVLYVQQRYPAEAPRAKLAIAVDQAVSLLQENGIKVSEDAINVLIESNLKELKRDFGDAWGQPPP